MSLFELAANEESHRLNKFLKLEARQLKIHAPRGFQLRESGAGSRCAERFSSLALAHTHSFCATGCSLSLSLSARDIVHTAHAYMQSSHEQRNESSIIRGWSHSVNYIAPRAVSLRFVRDTWRSQRSEDAHHFHHKHSWSWFSRNSCK